MGARPLDYLLLCTLALLWGSSYLWINVGLVSFPPLTLMAIRVSLAAIFLMGVLAIRGTGLPRDSALWRSFLIQSFVNSTGPWVLLAWGQLYVDSAVASVLNSTSPLFVFVLSFLIFGNAGRPGFAQLCGALLGFGGIILIIGPGALSDLGKELLPQAMVLLSALLYGVAALRGRVFAGIPPIVTATGTLICASLVLIPISLLVDRPWNLEPTIGSLTAVGILGILCTALAFLIYFRLLATIGPMGTASQAYLRSGVGVGLGVVFLSETLDLMTFAGICLAIGGVVLINWPSTRRM